MCPSQGHALGPHTLGPRHLPVCSSELTEKPDIHGLEGLESGRPARLTCSLPGYCGGESLSFSWVGAALDSRKPQSLRSSSVLTFTPRPGDHGTNLTCQVKRQGNWVITERTIRLNVSCEFGGMAGHWGPE